MKNPEIKERLFISGGNIRAGFKKFLPPTQRKYIAITALKGYNHTYTAVSRDS